MDQYNEMLQLIAAFNESKSGEDLRALMTLLTPAQVMVPARLTPELEKKVMGAAKMGKKFPLPPNPPLSFMMMVQEDGKKVFPIFLGKDQIPKEKMPPILATMPFLEVIKIVAGSNGEVGRIAVNPFTNGVTLAEPMIELIMKQLEQPVKRKVEMTIPEIHAMCHKRAIFEALPKKISSNSNALLEDFRSRKEEVLLEIYRSVYPEEFPCQYEEDDFGVMVLTLSDTLTVAQVDLPTAGQTDGTPVRVFVSFVSGGQSKCFAVVKDGNEEKFVQVDDKTNLIPVDKFDENSSELELVMELAEG